MDGLNAVELSLDEMLEDNEKFRFDSEFFKKEYLETYDFIKNKMEGIQLGNICSVLTDFSSNGSYKTIAENFELLDDVDYAYMVRTTDLEKQDYVNDVKYVNESSYEFLSKSKVYGGELLINKIGCPGKTFLMPVLNKPVSLGMNLLMLRIKEDSIYKEPFLWAYFNSRHGKNMIFRKVNGTVPQTIDKEAIKTLFIPKMSDVFVQKVIELISKKELYVKRYTYLFNEIEQLLYGFLEYNDNILNQSNNSIRTLKDSFLFSGRLDSEYYLKKYDSLFEFIKGKQHDYLFKLVKINKSNEPGSAYYVEDEGIPFVRVAELSKYNVGIPELKLDRNYDFTKNRIPKKGDILLSKDGSVGIAHYIYEEPNYVVSSSILQLSVKDSKIILPQYLTSVLNSKLVNMQSIRDTGGSIINHWSVDEINQVLIPILEMDKQKIISKKYDEACVEVINSKLVYDYAVKAVDLYFENGEQSAIEYINDKLNKFN